MKVARMSRVERRQLIRLGRRSNDPYTSLRFQASRSWGRVGAPRNVPDLGRGRLQLESRNVSRDRVGRSVQRPRWNGRSLPPPLLNRRCVKTLRKDAVGSHL
jgi:hypothetical protein